MGYRKVMFKTSQRASTAESPFGSPTPNCPFATKVVRTQWLQSRAVRFGCVFSKLGPPNWLRSSWIWGNSLGAVSLLVGFPDPQPSPLGFPFKTRQCPPKRNRATVSHPFKNGVSPHKPPPSTAPLLALVHKGLRSHRRARNHRGASHRCAGSLYPARGLQGFSETAGSKPGPNPVVKSQVLFVMIFL